MSHISISCPSGHRLRGKSEMVGRKVKCPKCASVFVVSLPHRSELTDTGVMEILGEADAPPPPPPDESMPATRLCPRCERLIAVWANVCEHCYCYVGQLPPEMQRIVGKVPPARH